jgi:hypothetical protein
MGVSSVRRWLKHFKDGKMDIADQPRCCRQKTAATGRIFAEKGETRSVQLATFGRSTNVVLRFAKNIRLRKLSSFNMTTRRLTLHE